MYICGFIYYVLCSLLCNVNRMGVGVSADTNALPKEFGGSRLPYTLLGYEGVSHYELRYDSTIPCNTVTLRSTSKD